MTELIGKDFIYSRVLFRCVLVWPLCSDNVFELEAMVAELIGKDSVYSRVLLRCVLVGPLCSNNVLELEGLCG